MKIKTSSHDLLIVEDNPWKWGAVLIMLVIGLLAGSFYFFRVGGLDIVGGVIFLICALSMMLILGFVARRFQGVFNATDGWVELRSKSILGYRAVRHSLDEIDHAIVQTTKAVSDEGTKYVHRVALVISEGQSKGEHPIYELHREGPEAETVAAQINRWLDRARSRT